jgi:hypothetical protein
LFSFPRNQVFLSLISCTVFFGLQFTGFCMIFIIFFLQFLFGLAGSCFSKFEMYHQSIYLRSNFLMWTFQALNFSLKTDFAITHKFW